MTKFTILSVFSFLFSAFCLLPIATQAQDIPSEIFGEYFGDAHISNTTFGIDETIGGISVELEETGTENDYFLKILDFNIIDTTTISIEMDKIIITSFEGGYNLSRAESINFTIPEVYVPPIPPYLPDGGIFYDVPVKVTLENSQLIDFVLKLNLEVVATITVVIIVPIPIPITFNIAFEGLLLASPPTIITTELPNGKVGEAYYAILEADGIPPIAWDIMNGSLPTGLNLDSQTGTIAGIPTEKNNFQFTISATNNWGYDFILLNIEIKDIDTTGIGTIEFAPFKVYPNPTTGELRMENGELKIKKVEIFDIYGRNILPLISHLLPHTTFDISYLQAGIYFIKIYTEKGVQTEKVIKK